MALKDLLISIRSKLLSDLVEPITGVHIFVNDNAGKYKTNDFPFIVVDTISSGDNIVDTARADIVETFSIAFKVFSKDIEKGLDISKEIQRMFLVSKPSLINIDLIGVEKLSETNDYDPDKDTDGNTIYQSIISMGFTVNFSLI